MNEENINETNSCEKTTVSRADLAAWITEEACCGLKIGNTICNIASDVNTAESRLYKKGLIDSFKEKTFNRRSHIHSDCKYISKSFYI